MVAESGDWATALVESWPDDPALAVPDRAVMRELVARAAWSEDSR